jgi:hypothetical protein
MARCRGRAQRGLIFSVLFRREKGRYQKKKGLINVKSTVGILFCLHCGSSLVDVNSWESPSIAILECADCGHVSMVEGFSIGRVSISGGDLEGAARDVALPGGDHRIKRVIIEAADKTIKELSLLLSERRWFDE